MKKLYSLLFMLTILFVGKSYANRDRVANRSYGTNISAPYNIQVSTKNMACGTKKTYPVKDIFSSLNITGLEWASWYKNSASKFICEKNVVNWPIGTTTGKFKIYASNKEILTLLWIPEKIKESMSWNYSQEFSVAMNILVDMNGTKTTSWDTDFEFSDIANPFSLVWNNNTIEYSDESECQECTKITTWTSATWDSCNGEWENRTCTNNTCKAINIPAINSPNQVCTTSPCFDDNITPPTIDFIEANECESSLIDWINQFICYANSTLNFGIKLKTLWTWYTPKWIENLNLSINNWENNTPLSPVITQKINISNTWNYQFSIASEKFTKKGKYTLEFQWEWLGNNPSTFSPLKIIKLIIIPNNNYESEGTTEISGDAFANNSDKIHICQKLTDSYWNKFGKDYGNLWSNSFNIKEWITLNKVTKSWWEALNIKNILFNNSQICFDMISKTPDEKLVNIELLIPKHSQEENSELISSSSSLVINPHISFKKPFIGLLKASKDEKKTWTASPEVGTNMDYKLELLRKASINVNPSINNFKENITVGDRENHKIENVSSPSPLLNLLQIDTTSLILSPYFSLRVNTSKTAKSVVKNPEIILNPCPIISYTLAWNQVSYYLSATEDDFDNNDFIKIWGIDNFKGVKIIGTTQWSGKYKITGQKENFSDIYKSTLREAIKKNAYSLIKWMKSGQTINKVKYSEWDVIISWENLDFETLIVKNGNVIINDNLNKNGKKLWIIVLKDNYDTKMDFNTSGNIYITPDVSYINALFYADGGFISTDTTGKVYTSDSSKRTANLQNQLILKWSLFTRNTIGGAIFSGWDYTLPGWQKTDDFDNAMIYDLNYIRRGNRWCQDNNTNGKCDTFDDVFIIEYNPAIQQDPPAWF